MHLFYLAGIIHLGRKLNFQPVIFFTTPLKIIFSYGMQENLCMNTPQEKLYNAWQYPKYFSRCRAYRPLALSQNSRSQLTEQHRALCRIWQVWGLNLKQAGKQPTFQGLPQAAVDFPALSLDLSSPSGPSLFSSGFCSKGMSWAIPLNTLLTLLGSLLSSTPLQRLQLSLIPWLWKKKMSLRFPSHTTDFFRKLRTFRSLYIMY